MKIYATADYSWSVAIEGPAAYGESFDVDDETAEALELQGWSRRKPAKRPAAGPQSAAGDGVGETVGDTDTAPDVAQNEE